MHFGLDADASLFCPNPDALELLRWRVYDLAEDLLQVVQRHQFERFLALHAWIVARQRKTRGRVSEQFVNAVRMVAVFAVVGLVVGLTTHSQRLRRALLLTCGMTLAIIVAGYLGIMLWIIAACVIYHACI